MDAEGGDPPHRLPPSECPALAGADSPRDPEEGKPASPPSADTPEGYPPDRTETVKTPPSAEKMVGLPDCPPETTLQGDEQKLDDLDSCGAANRSPQSQPLWGEALSRLPKPPIYHRDSNSGVSHRREPQDPGLHRLAEKAGSVDSSSFSSYWGEIETEPEPSDSLSRATKLMYHPVSGKQRPTALKGSTPNGDGAFDTEPSHWDSGQPEESDPALLAMFHAVANSRLAVKSQQKDEPDFTPAEKLAILRDLYHTKPLVFLERFRKALHEEHLPCFRHISGSYEADFYCAEVRRASLGKTQHTRVRNKRYAALQQLIRGGEYFSDEQMRSRDPLLYEQYIGQYLSDEELQVLGSCKLEASCPLSGVLLDSYQEQVIQRRLQIQQEQEEACGEEDEESDSDVDEAEALDSEMEECALDEEEKALLREEFTSRMYQRFLDGKDRDFNYSEVDENPDFDNLDIVSRDEEERYFDGEDPEDADAMDEE